MPNNSFIDHPNDTAGAEGDGLVTLEQLRSAGWAPGNYQSRCASCHQLHYEGDKRCIRCRPCATKTALAVRDQPKVITPTRPSLDAEGIARAIRKATLPGAWEELQSFLSAGAKALNRQDPNLLADALCDAAARAILSLIGDAPVRGAGEELRAAALAFTEAERRQKAAKTPNDIHDAIVAVIEASDALQDAARALCLPAAPVADPGVEEVVKRLEGLAAFHDSKQRHYANHPLQEYLGENEERAKYHGDLAKELRQAAALIRRLAEELADEERLSHKYLEMAYTEEGAVPVLWETIANRYRARLSELEGERDRLREALTEILAECHNGGYPNEIVATRMIERIEETAAIALSPLPPQPVEGGE